MTIAEIKNEIRSAALDGTPLHPAGVPLTLANLLIAQAEHETDNFTHHFFTSGNNAFGYSFVANAKWQLPEPGGIADNGEPVAQYASIGNSTREMIDWIFRRVKEGKFPANLNTITTPERYAQLLKNAGYYGDTVENYAAGLLKYWRPVVGGSAIVIAGLLLIWMLTQKTTVSIIGVIFGLSEF